jgi:transcriptional regulator with XRE-family HTH domain
MPGFRQSLHSVPDESFGSMLRARRFAANETQAQLAGRLGTRQQTVGGWERGDRPQRRFLAPLADYVGISGGEAALHHMLDQEQELRNDPGLRQNRDRSPDSVEENAVAVQALAAVVKAYSAKVAIGGDLTGEEMALMSRAMEALENHLGASSRS